MTASLIIAADGGIVKVFDRLIDHRWPTDSPYCLECGMPDDLYVKLITEWLMNSNIELEDKLFRDLHCIPYVEIL